MNIKDDLQQELLQFVSDSEKKTHPKPLRTHLTEELLRQIMRGEREIADICTNQKTGDVFARFCFTKDL